MAIYHLNLKSGSRGGGQSAAAKLDYIEREGKYEQGKAEIAHVEHGNMPKFAQENPREYWAGADSFERANGRLFTQIEFALPKELNHEQQIALAREFVQSVCADEHQLPYSFAIHKGQYDHSGKRTNAEAKPHVHLIFSERENDGITRSAEQWFKRANKKDPAKGGASKVRKIKAAEWLESQRETWARLANQALAKAGHDARIDHRTLEAQGITGRLPQIKKGAAQHIEKRGEKTDRMKAHAARLSVNQMLKRLTDESRSFDEQIALLKADIHRAVKYAYRHQADPEHERSFTHLPAADFDHLATPDSAKSFSDFETHSPHTEQHHEPKPNSRLTSNLMRGLPERRDDIGNLHHKERGENRRADILQRHASDDVEARRTTLHQPVQPIREQSRNADRKRIENQAAERVIQHDYQRLQMYADNAIRAREEARQNHDYYQQRTEPLQAKHAQLTAHIKENQQAISALKNAFLGSIRYKKDIATLEESLARTNRQFTEVKKELAQLPERLERSQKAFERADEEMQISILAMQVSGIQHRARRLHGQPEALRREWQTLEKRLAGMRASPSQAISHERRIRQEFDQFTKTQSSRQPFQNKDKNTWER